MYVDRSRGEPGAGRCLGGRLGARGLVASAVPPVARRRGVCFEYLTSFGPLDSPRGRHWERGGEGRTRGVGSKAVVRAARPRDGRVAPRDASRAPGRGCRGHDFRVLPRKDRLPARPSGSAPTVGARPPRLGEAGRPGKGADLDTHLRPIPYPRVQLRRQVTSRFL